MQSRRWQQGSSGELDVFGATSYFAGRADCATVVAQPAAADDRLKQQQKMVMREKRMAESFRVHDLEQLVGVLDRLRHEKEMEVELAKPAGKSNLAAFFGFMVSAPSPGASFRRRPPPPSPTSNKSTAAGDESVKVSSYLSTAPSRRSSGDLTAGSSADAGVQLEGRRGYYGLDLGVATGDRRLQGVKVVRSTSSGANQDMTWVVRCTPCWDHQEKFDAASRNYYHVDHVEEEEDSTTSPCNWESDSSSDLFDLDMECVDL